jgi:hypothetical protein
MDIKNPLDTDAFAAHYANEEASAAELPERPRLDSRDEAVDLDELTRQASLVENAVSEIDDDKMRAVISLWKNDSERLRSSKMQALEYIAVTDVLAYVMLSVMADEIQKRVPCPRCGSTRCPGGMIQTIYESL